MRCHFVEFFILNVCVCVLRGKNLTINVVCGGKRLPKRFKEEQKKMGFFEQTRGGGRAQMCTNACGDILNVLFEQNLQHERVYVVVVICLDTHSSTLYIILNYLTRGFLLVIYFTQTS